MNKLTFWRTFYGFLFTFVLTTNAGAQDKIYANGVANTPSHTTNATQAYDGNLNTAATVSASPGAFGGLGAYTGNLELQYTTAINANTPAYIKLRTDDNILSYLLGGSLGGLISDVAGNILTGNQRLSVQVNNGSTTLFTEQSWTTGNFTTDRCRIIYNGLGEYYLRVVPSATYNRIRLTNSVGSLVGLNTVKTMDVYDAFHIDGTASCGIGNYTSYNSTGLTVDLLNLGGSGVTNPQYAIDADSSNSSELAIGIVGVAASVSQTVYFEGPSDDNDTYYIKFSVPPSLISLDVLNRIHLTSYNGTTQTGTYTMSDLLDLDLLTLLGNGTPVTVAINPTASDRVTLTLGTTVDVSVAQTLNLYGIVKGDFDLSVTGAGSYEINDTITLTAAAEGCNAPYTYTWSGDMAGSGATLSPPSDTPGTYSYTVTVTDIYGITERQTIEVTVEAPPVGGSANGDSQDICDVYQPDDITLTDYTGSVLRWESSLTGDFTDAVTINNTTATLTSDEIGVLSQDTYFRAVIGNFTYDEVYSDPAEITLRVTTWDGTSWNNGSPDSETAALFTGDYNEDTDIQACRLEVFANADVTLVAGRNATVHNAVVVDSEGSFTVEHNANLVQVNNVANSGNIRVEKTSSELYRLDYTLWSSPVIGQNMFDFSPATITSRFYYYDTVNSYYTNVSDTDDTDFVPGIGVLIRMPNGYPASGATAGYNEGLLAVAFEGVFEGVAENGDINIPLTLGADNYNAVGNPYPSAISVVDFFAANSSNMDPSSGLYFWRKKNDPTVSSYATLTLAGYTTNPVPGGETSDGVFDDLENQENWVINSGQGFFVKATSSNLAFTNSMRRAINNNQFFREPGQGKNENGEEASRYWLNLTSTDELGSQLLIAYTDHTTNNPDYGWDAESATVSSYIALYSINQEKRYAIQARSPFTPEDSIPLGFKVTDAGAYTIALDHMDGLFTGGQNIYLYDNFNTSITNLKDQNYVFTTEGGIYDARFEIVYTTESLATTAPAATDSDVLVYQNEGTITVKAANRIINTVTIYDTRGRVLYVEDNVNDSEWETNSLTPALQVLIININTTQGVVNKKIAL